MSSVILEGVEELAPMLAFLAESMAPVGLASCLGRTVRGEDFRFVSVTVDVAGSLSRPHDLALAAVEPMAERLREVFGDAVECIVVGGCSLMAASRFDGMLTVELSLRVCGHGVLVKYARPRLGLVRAQ